MRKHIAAAFKWSSHLSRLRQSSSVILKRLCGVLLVGFKTRRLFIFIYRQPKLNQHGLAIAEVFQND